jgi:nitroreductase
MSGIVFLHTSNLEGIKAFYQTRIGMRLWLDQGECVILEHGNLLLGFYRRDNGAFPGLITFFFETREAVDSIYHVLSEVAETAPKVNPNYGIYHFFARDSEGRRLEFQSSLHPLEPYLSGTELLLQRRSVREYQQDPVPDEVLWKVFELCRYAPTSRNSQSYTYTVVRDHKKIESLARIREPYSGPIGSAPLAVSISTDPKLTGRPDQDGCIAAYHLMLAARAYGLGTCWIADMDRELVKEILGLPKEHYVATITPLGYPASWPAGPGRREVEEMVRFFP